MHSLKCLIQAPKRIVSWRRPVFIPRRKPNGRRSGRSGHACCPWTCCSLLRCDGDVLPNKAQHPKRCLYAESLERRSRIKRFGPLVK